ncbi:MAG: PEPxxWA-CTERM sorting domain-containing protein [Roseiarcus sp.]
MKAMLAAAGVALLFAGSSAQAGVIYATGFEPPTFTTGLIAGQDGWSEYPSPSAAAQVESAFVYAGSQAVDVIPALAAGQDGPYKAVSTAAPIVVQSAEIYIASSTTQSEWQFAALGAGLTGFAGGIDILANNQIELIAAGLPIIGTTWTRDAWINVALTLDYATQTFDVTLNGVTIGSNEPFCGDNGPCLGANVPAYADGFFDSFGPATNGGITGVNDIGFMDNYSVSTPVPEPATWAMALLGFAGLGYATRRKANVARAALAA